MAEALDVPLCDMSFEDIKLRYSKKKKAENQDLDKDKEE